MLLAGNINMKTFEKFDFLCKLGVYFKKVQHRLTFHLILDNQEVNDRELNWNSQKTEVR